MSHRSLIAAALIAAAATSLAAQTTVRAKAKAFTLDSVAPTPTPPVDAAPAPDPASESPPAVTPTLPEDARVAAPAAPLRATFTLDTPIQALIADPAARAVLDKDLPGMSDDPNLAKFQMLSLRSLQPQTGGQLSNAMLARVASDLDVLGGGTGMTKKIAPVKAGNSRRNNDTSR